MSLELEVGELKGRMTGFEKEIQNLQGKVSSMDKKLDTVVDYISQAKGGWKATTLLVSVSGGTGAFVAFLLKRMLT